MMLPESPEDVLQGCQEEESLQALRCSALSGEIAGITLLVNTGSKRSQYLYKGNGLFCI